MKRQVNPVELTQAQVSTVPVPGAVWLLGSSLLGAWGLRKKKKMQ